MCPAAWESHRKHIRKALTLPPPGFGGLPDFFGEQGLSQSGMSYTIFVVNNIVDNNLVPEGLKMHVVETVDRGGWSPGTDFSD